MTMPTAKEVAKHLDRRQQRRKLVVGTTFVGLAVLAALYLRCGHGWGLGGTGSGNGTGAGSGSAVATADAGPKRCQIRVEPKQILVDGAPHTRDQAVAICRHTAGADVVVTGDARHGDWEDLRAALEAAKVDVLLKNP